jgi:hypothetical protein
VIANTAFAVPPPLSEAARKTSKSDSEVVVEDVNDMKEKVIDKKTQMKLFRQLLKSEAIESSFPIVNITHVNEMSSRYKIFSMSYSIDDERIYTYYLDDNIGKQNLGRETSVFKGPLTPGNHELTIDIIYRGNDTGVFSYINDYKTPVQSKKSFKVDKGQKLDIQVVGYEKGWALTEFKDRPDVKVKFYSTKQAKDLK